MKSFFDFDEYNLSIFYALFFKYSERERERTNKQGRGRVRGRERILGGLHAHPELNAELDLKTMRS